MDINAVEKLSYGIYIVASGNESEKNAFVATTVFQVTAEPMQLAVACNKKNHTRNFIEKHQSFSVSVFQKDYNPSVMGNFGFRSGKEVDKFTQCNYIWGSNTHVPIVLDDALAWFECKVVNQIDVGTHILYIGEVLDCKLLSTKAPLTYAYYHEVKKGTTPKNAPHSTPQTANSANNNQNTNAMKYVCKICGYVYDPEVGDADGGIAPGTKFEDIPDDWSCPLCGVSKSDFEPMV